MGCRSDYVGSTYGVPHIAADPSRRARSAALGQKQPFATLRIAVMVGKYTDIGESNRHQCRTQSWTKMKETQHVLKSIHLANERAVWVREPEHRATSVTVFLDAELYRDRVGATSIIDALDSNGDIDSSLFVFISIESVASRWVECPCYSRFAQFIEEELFPWLERTYPSALEAQERVIAGLSYTGLAAAYVSMMNPSRFTKVIAQSGSFWWNDCWIIAHFEKLVSGCPNPRKNGGRWWRRVMAA
jgi:enterochelin esterase-like enzyme